MFPEEDTDFADDIAAVVLEHIEEARRQAPPAAASTLLQDAERLARRAFSMPCGDLREEAENAAGRKVATRNPVLHLVQVFLSAVTRSFGVAAAGGGASR